MINPVEAPWDAHSEIGKPPFVGHDFQRFAELLDESAQDPQSEGAEFVKRARCS